MLDSLDLLSSESKKNIVNWIYSLQVDPKGGFKSGGFQVGLNFGDF